MGGFFLDPAEGCSLCWLQQMSPLGPTVILPDGFRELDILFKEERFFPDQCRGKTVQKDYIHPLVTLNNKDLGPLNQRSGGGGYLTIKYFLSNLDKTFQKEF